MLKYNIPRPGVDYLYFRTTGKLVSDEAINAVLKSHLPSSAIGCLQLKGLDRT